MAKTGLLSISTLQTISSSAATADLRFGGCGRLTFGGGSSHPFRTAGTLAEMRVDVPTNSGRAWTFYPGCFDTGALVAGSQSVLVPEATTGVFADLVNTDTITPPNASTATLWRIGATRGGTAVLATTTVRSIGFSFTAASGATVHSIRKSDFGAWIVVTARYDNLAGTGGGWGGVAFTETSSGPLPEAGTVRNGTVHCNANTRNGTCTVTLRNNDVDTTIAVVVTAATTGWFTDSNAPAVAAGDELAWHYTLAGSSGTVQLHTLACEYVPSSESHLYLAGGSSTGGGLVGPLATTYFPIAAHASAHASNGYETPVPVAFRAKGAGFSTSSNGVTATVTLVINGVDSAMTGSVTGTGVMTWQSFDVGSAVAVAAGDLLALKVENTHATNNFIFEGLLLHGEPANAAPTVDAGPDQTGIDILEVVQLDGTVSDDGQPNPPGALTLTWSKQSGPGTATFSSTSVVDPTVTLSAQGTYVLRLTASDSVLSAYDEMTITVGSAVDPGNSICGEENVLTWIEQTSTLTDDTTATRVTSDAALNDPSTYYSGKKEPRVLELPTITRALSDVRGQWQAGTMRWREAETDRIVRRRYAGATTYPLSYTTDVCRMIRERDWRDRETARLMFVGHRLRSTPAEDLSIEHESGDVLARDLEKGGEEQQLPSRLFASSFTPGIPTALIDVPEPIIYGRESDAVAPDTPPSLIASATTGGYMEAVTFPIHGFAPMPGPTPPAALTPSEGAGSLMLGDQPADTFYFNIVGLNAAGEWGDPAYFAINAEVSHVLTGNSKSITVTWANPGGNTAATWRVYMGYWVSGVRIAQYRDVSGAATSCTFDNMPDQTEIGVNDWTQLGTGCAAADVGYYNYIVAAVLASGEVTAVNAANNRGFARYYAFPRVARIEVDETTLPGTATDVRVWRVPPGWVAGQPTYGYFTAPITQTNAAGHVYVDDDWVGTGLTVEDPQIEQGAFDITGYYGGQELLPAYGTYWHRWFVCGHAVKAIDGVYIAGTTNYPTSTKLAGEIGVTWLVPGGANYSYAATTPYRDFNGRRYTVIYGHVGIGDIDEIAGGTGTIRVNVQGIEAVGDASGALLTDIHDQFKHWMTNFFLQDYQTGAWLSVPTWEPIAGWPKIDTGAWDTAKAAAAAAFGAELTGGGVIAEQAGKRDWLARWLVSSGTRIGINAGGQWTLVRHDPTAAVAAATYTEVRHIQAGSLTFDPLHDEHWMTIPYRFNLRNGEWSEGEVTDQTAIDDYGEERNGPTFDLYFVKSAAVAEEVMTLLRDRHKTLPWRVSFETIDLCATNSDLGDVIGLTHTAGLDVTGWTNFLLMVEGHVTMPGQVRVRLTGRTNQAPHE